MILSFRKRKKLPEEKRERETIRRDIEEQEVEIAVRKRLDEQNRRRLIYLKQQVKVYRHQ